MWIELMPQLIALLIVIIFAYGSWKHLQDL